MRIHELAKELEITSKELMERLAKMGIPAKSHMSRLDPAIAVLVKNKFSAGKKKPGPPAAEKGARVPEQHDEKDIIKKPPREERPAPREAAPAEKETVPPPPAKLPKEEDNIPPEKKMKIEFPITAKELALKLNIKPNELISKLMSLGVFASINQNLDRDTVDILLQEYGLFLVEGTAGESFTENLEKRYKQPDKKEDLVPRPPVVTFMGHVDHGKTSLMDAIRKTRVAESEFGGISQHIGAYEVSLPQGKIVFLDTPGHEAFTAMRARGANITDIAVLVVAADEGIMPQTLEAIDHAKAAGVPIIVAINKIDKPAANPEKVKRQLAQHNIKLEGWGGDVISCEVSAKKNIGIGHFLEMILLQAELIELKANPKRPAWGTIIESKVTKERGPIVNVLVRTGTLRTGDPLICGMYHGKAKALINDKGARISEAGPSTPVEILGISGAPDAGSDFYVLENEKEARWTSQKWQAKARHRMLSGRQRATLNDLYRQLKEGLKELKIIVKADTQGSVEALSLALERLSTPKIGINIIHSATGNIKETDVSLAMASNAVIVGLHVQADARIKNICKKENIDIRLYNIIYQAVEEVQAAMQGMLEAKITEEVTGRAKIRQVFRISKTGPIAGCIVTEGKITRNAKARVIRGEETVYEDQIISLKRGKNDVRDVQTGAECGLRVGKFDKYVSGDTIETYILKKEEQTL